MNHSELSHVAGAVDDSTINIVVVIIIFIIRSLCIQQQVHTVKIYTHENPRKTINVQKGKTHKRHSMTKKHSDSGTITLL